MPSGPELSARLKRRITEPPALIVPGVANALAALVVERIGFEAAYVTGAGVANTYLGVPDIGLVTLTELREHVAAIRDVIELPLIVDADTGFGNPIGVQRTVRQLEHAGANALQLEDQVSPKRCGHFGGKSVVSTQEMVQKIRAAVDARVHDSTLIIARTDARATEGFDAALDRVMAYADAGADMTFLEAPQSAEELLSIPARMSVPQVVNLVEGGVTPLLPAEQLAEFGIVLFANAALQASVHGMDVALRRLRETGSLPDIVADLAGWEERQGLVRKAYYDELELAYSQDPAATAAPAGS